MKPRKSQSELERRMRGGILAYVRQAGDMGLTVRCIAIFLNSFHWKVTPATVEEDCTFLMGKGYLNKEDLRDEVSGVERRVYRVTAKGLDLLQGAIPPDPEVCSVW